MGIPTYFKNIFYKYNDVLIKNNEVIVDNFYMDLNCLIHPCTKNLYTNNEIINNIIKKMKEIIELVNPKKRLYIAIDGVCPISKMITQKKRRIKSIKEKNELIEIYKKFDKEYKSWNKNQISPGTDFMLNLSDNILKYLKDYKKENKIKIILSDSNTVEEGEQKIIKYIRKNKSLHNDINCIYGLDSDLIILSLGLNINNLYLYREKVEFYGNYNVEYDKFVYFDIDLFRKYIIEDLDFEEKYNKNDTIKDYIFLSFLLGNDFVVKLPSIQIRYGGIDEVMDSYIKIRDKLKENLIINSENFIINYKFFIQLIKDISEKEEKLLYKIHRKFEREPIEMKYDDNLSELEIFLKKREIIDYLSIDNPINYNKKGYKKRYYEINFNFIKDNNNLDEYYKHKNEVCLNYFESLKWCMMYYSNNKIPDWNFYYKYNYGPFVSDLYFYLINNKNNVFKNIKFNYNSKPLLPYTQLSLILPKEDFIFLPETYKNIFKNCDIEKYYPNENNIKCDYIYKLFNYESILLLDIPDFNLIINEVKKCKLSEDEKKKNINKLIYII